jgi:pimeloyl-ACP methyl ester carboxylesterase
LIFAVAKCGKLRAETARRITSPPQMPYGFAMPVTISTGSSYCVELLPRVQLPTLVLRCRHDNGAPFEQNRLLARSIARAKFVTLESDNHVVLAGEPAWPRLISEIAAFLIAAFLAE